MFIDMFNPIRADYDDYNEEQGEEPQQEEQDEELVGIRYKTHIVPTWNSKFWAAISAKLERRVWG